MDCSKGKSSSKNKSVTASAAPKRVTFPDFDFDVLSSTDSSSDWEDVLEKKIEDLSRQLAEERQICRKEKSQVARLQRELSKHKADKDRTLERATLLKDIEKERMLRADAEKRLHEITIDSENCHSRLQNLQGEFRKMEEMVKNMMQHKTKIDQLKQEKSSLSITYENNLQKYRNHISNLERENMMLLNDVKRIENQTQMDGKIDDRSKLLLERLKMLEAENSALVLENEQQRQQYEKCLDEIANQVVQALLAQKTLREECVKLQKRVQDLEHQNQELNHMFQHKNQYGSDSVLQSLPPGHHASTGTLCDTQSQYNSVTSLPAADQITTAISLTQTMHLSPMSQYILQNTVAQKCLQHCIPDSTESLQSIFTDYNCDEALRSRSVSSPPVWTADDRSMLPRQRSNTASTTSSVVSNEHSSEYTHKTKIETEFPATPSSPKMKHINIHEHAKSKRSFSTSSIPQKASPKPSRAKSAGSAGRSKIAQPVVSRSFSNVTNPRELSIQTSQSEVRKSLSNPDHIDKVSVSGSPKRVPVSSKVQSSAVKMAENKNIAQTSKIPGKRINTKVPSSSQSHAPSNSVLQTKIAVRQPIRQNRNSGESGRKASTGSSDSASHNVLESGYSSSKLQMPQVKSSKNVILQPLKSAVDGTTTPTDEKINAIKDSLGSPPSVPLLPKAQYFYDYSDEDSDINRPVSADFSTTSTVSLNELLEDDDTDTLLDEDFTAEAFAFFETPTFPKSNHPIKEANAKKLEKAHYHHHHRHNLHQDSFHQERGKTSSLGSKPDIVKDTMNCEIKLQSRSPHVIRRRTGVNSSKRKGHLSQRPSSLILAPREKQFLYHGYSSSSLSSTDSDEPWSPRLERQCHPHKVKRKSSSSSNRSSYNSPSHASDKQSLKSSQELVTMETPRVPPPTSVSSESLSKQASIITVASVSQSTESLNSNSLTRRKGPPPPVPKKPMPGKKSGIRMGVQSPGFRQSKVPFNYQTPEDPKETTMIPKPHEFKMDLSTTQDVVLHCHSNQYKKDFKQVLIPKYISSDSSFEGSKLDKVERSGSKDDGYSTMSSDIQPEIMEKYSDASLNKMDTLVRQDSARPDQNIIPAVSIKSLKSSPETISDPDSVMESSSHSSDMKNSSASLSSPNSIFSDDRSTMCGSLGRVKAMKMFFEAENQKSSENKQVNFPLRKSPSVDSSLCARSNKNSENLLKRYSLGDEIRNFENEDFSVYPENLNNDITPNVQHHEVEIKEEIKQPEVKRGVSSMVNANVPKPLAPEKAPSFHPLNFSEENFLSDIPEEKDEWEQSTNSSVNQLEMSSKFFPLIRHLEQVHMLKPRKDKQFWSSLQGLSRVLSDSEINNYCKSKSDEDLDKILLKNKQCDKPLERSVSLSELSKLSTGKPTMKLCPMLHRSMHVGKMDQLEALEKVQEIAKKQILQQLSYALESESDDDLERMSFVRVMEIQQKKDARNSKMVQKMSNLCNVQKAAIQGQKVNFDGRPKSLPVREDLSKETSPAPSSDGQCIERERQSTISSVESSPCQEVNSKFRSDYYSLCMVGSKGSLFSGSTDGDMDHAVSNETTQSHTCQENPGDCTACKRNKNTEEFDEISRQLASLSKTVNALHQSLSSLNSHDSDTESNEDKSQMFPTENFQDTDGYQWVEDEFYLTPCGGEIIMGNSPFSETGACVDWVNEYIDDTSCNDEFEYYGNIHNADPNATCDFTKMCSSISEEVSNDNGVGEATVAMDTEVHGEITQADDAAVLDPKLREAMLDSMIHLSGASMDSLDDNIGVDHVMCSRLLGRGEKDQGPIRSAQGSRQAVNLSKFFVRYGEHEKEAVAAFDFLDDISTSPDTSQQEITPMAEESPRKASEKSKIVPSSQSLQKTSSQRELTSERKSCINERSVIKSGQTVSGSVPGGINSSNAMHQKKFQTNQATANQIPQNKQSSSKKEPQGAGFSFTSKLKQPQGLVHSSTTTNEKSAKNKPKEDKKLMSRLPRKLIPVRDKTKKAKSESKIPKASR